MRWGGRALVLAAALGWAAPALAETGIRPLCADRPGLGTPACTLDPGHVQVEVGLADWTLDRQPDARTDTVQFGDFLLRVGLASRTELQLGWTAYGHVRGRDRASGLVDSRSGVGDVTLALRQNILSPDGSGTALAVMPYASLPTGGGAIGAGTWSAGLRVPFGFSLSDRTAIAFTPAVEAAADADGHGRHLAFGTVAGLALTLSESVEAAAEIQVTRDDDPSGHATEFLAGLAADWQPGGDFEIDAGANVGLNHSSPDIELYAGITRRF
jgi:hypothetical protein